MVYGSYYGLCTLNLLCATSFHVMKGTYVIDLENIYCSLRFIALNGLAKCGLFDRARSNIEWLSLHCVSSIDGSCSAFYILLHLYEHNEKS